MQSKAPEAIATVALPRMLTDEMDFWWCKTYGDSFIFVFGVDGQRGMCTFLRYNVTMNVWNELRKPPIKGYNLQVAMTCSSNTIYMVILRFIMGCVCCKYIIERDTWESFPTIPESLYAADACYVEGNGCMYVASKDNLTPALWAFDARCVGYTAESWFAKTPPEPHGVGGSMFLIHAHNNLYAIGASVTLFGEVSPPIEEYSIENDQWTFVELTEGSFFNFPAGTEWCFLFNEEIIISGGTISTIDGEMEPNRDLLKFNPREKILTRSTLFGPECTCRDNTVFGVVHLPL